MEVHSFICVPIIYEGVSEGILAVDNIYSKRPLQQTDLNLLLGLAPQVSIGIQNAKAYQNLEKSERKLKESLDQLQKVMDGTILAISKMVESRDPYTSGHQERVSMLATQIAERMKLPEEKIAGIRIAAAMHDIGKINVPAEILSSPRKLTEIEYGMIKLHPEVGYDILKTIDFTIPIAQIVLQHHEMMDGSGYPKGITGDEIMLESRIIAVADVVESMASHRPYRPSLGIEQALSEIKKSRGVRYDPKVVDTCLELFREGKLSL
jgi:HD-GYP domain-containing protein (c-di-GMP phosphodiesterase class II)